MNKSEKYDTLGEIKSRLSLLSISLFGIGGIDGVFMATPIDYDLEKKYAEENVPLAKKFYELVSELVNENDATPTFRASISEIEKLSVELSERAYELKLINLWYSLTTFKNNCKKYFECVFTDSRKQGADTGKESGTLPEIPNEKKFKKLMKSFVDADFASDLENNDNGCLWKWDENNKGLFDFVCGRFFCGDKVKNGKLVFGSGRMPRNKIAPYFSNISTKDLGNQRNQWKSEQANDRYGFSVSLPSGWEEAEAIITQFIKT